MSDVSGGELKFTNGEELDRWLRTQPREVNIVIAARAALRVLPLLHVVVVSRKSQGLAIFASFWATALARVAAKYPARANKLPAVDAYHAALTAAAANAAANSAANATYVATTAAAAAAQAVARPLRGIVAADLAADLAANVAAATNTATNTAVNVVTATLAAADIWTAVSADANRLNGVSTSDLASEALWPQGKPRWAANNWVALQGRLPEKHWRPWLDWYARRQDGGELSEEAELLFATLPVDPGVKDLAVQNADLAAEIERLRKPDPPLLNPELARAVERVVHDPHGADVAIVEGEACIVGAASADDLAAAQDPQTRQLHERTKVRAAAALAQAKRLHNQGGFGNIAETVDEFSKWISGDTESIAQNISTVWELTVAIGTFLDRDDKAGSTLQDMTPKMDLAAREALDQLIISAAPFVRRFPTALANDEAYRAFKQPKDPVAPSLRLVVDGTGAQVIQRETGAVLKIALEASEREGPQAEKSSRVEFVNRKESRFRDAALGCSGRGAIC